MNAAAAISPSSPDWSMLSLAEQDPFPTYEALKLRGPVIWDPGMKAWLVLSYDLCKVIETDENTYRNHLEKNVPPVWYEIKGGKTAVTSLYGEEHTRMRRLYLKLLSPTANVKYRTEHVIPVINDAIDRFASQGRAELISQFADVIPARVMGSMFGLPWRDDALMTDVARWHREIVAWLYNKHDPELTRVAKSAADELNKIFLPLVLERRDKPGTDLISQIWLRAPEDWGPVGVDDIMALVRDISIGAGETTTNAIANAVYLFLSDPALRQAVTKDQVGALNAFIEETLRLFGAIQFRFRIANRDVTLGGVQIQKDDSIIMVHAAANRDPEHYACPHMIDLHRTTPTDHVAFNVGPRICPGMHFARLKMRESVKALIARLPDVRLDSTKEKPRFRGFSHRSFGPLHVVFEEVK